MTHFAYLNNMTIPQLREVASQMDIKLPSRAKKIEIVERLDMEISLAQSEAVMDDIRHDEETTRDADHPDNFVPTYTVRDDNGTELATFTGDSALIMERHNRNIKRYNPNMVRDRDGKVVLTAKQRRRIQKNLRKYGRKIGFLSPKGA